MDRCAHSVYVVPADWQVQEAAGIPTPQRVAWYCWLCREFEAPYRHSVQKLLELARQNCGGKLPVRKTDAAVLNADYDLPPEDEIAA